MKIFWKMFFATMIILVTGFGVCSYIVTNVGFKHSLKLAVSLSYTENEMLQYLIVSKLKDPADISEKRIADSASSVNFQNKRSMFYRIFNFSGQVLYSNFPWDTGKPLSERLNSSTKSYEIIPKGKDNYILASVPLTVNGELFFTETLKNINEIFVNIKKQRRDLFISSIIITNLCEIMIFGICWVILRPLSSLSDAARQLADGKLYTRVYIDSDDEVGILADSFNDMAQHVEEIVDELNDNAARQERFTGYFAHELKTPLTSIIGYADMLRSRRQSEENIITYSNCIYEEGIRLESMSMKLLNMIYLRKQELDFRRISASYYLENICVTVAPMMSRKNIVFNTDIEEATILIEPNLIKTVILNIIDNATKAIEDSGRITLTGSLSKDEYLISVQDNGRGMTPEELSHVTDEFYMADKKRSRAQGGTGLGLVLCAEIIQLHNAQMLFSSVPGVGTVVTVHLKAVKTK